MGIDKEWLQGPKVPKERGRREILGRHIGLENQMMGLQLRKTNQGLPPFLLVVLTLYTKTVILEQRNIPVDRTVFSVSQLAWNRPDMPLPLALASRASACVW